MNERLHWDTAPNQTTPMNNEGNYKTIQQRERLMKIVGHLLPKLDRNFTSSNSSLPPSTSTQHLLSSSSQNIESLRIIQYILQTFLSSNNSITNRNGTKPSRKPLSFHLLKKFLFTQLHLQNNKKIASSTLSILPFISMTTLGVASKRDWVKSYISSISKSFKQTSSMIRPLSNIPYSHMTVHHLSMIEILIAISIIVTFSGLTGAVLAQVYEESRVSNALLDLSKLQEGLVLYYTRHGKYPLALEDLLTGGELNKVPKDPWGTDYLYVPHLDWNRLNRLLLTTTTGGSGASQQQQQQLSYFNEVLKRMETVLVTLPGGSVTPMSLLAIANEQPFCICVGTKIPRFPSKIDVDVSRERIRYVASLMKMSMERSSFATGSSASNQQSSSAMNQISELNTRIKNVLNIAKSNTGNE